MEQDVPVVALYYFWIFGVGVIQDIGCPGYSGASGGCGMGVVVACPQLWKMISLS